MSNKDLLKLAIINFIIVFLGSYLAIAMYMSQYSLPQKMLMNPPKMPPIDRKMQNQMPPTGVNPGHPGKMPPPPPSAPGTMPQPSAPAQK